MILLTEDVIDGREAALDAVRAGHEQQRLHPVREADAAVGGAEARHDALDLLLVVVDAHVLDRRAKLL
jgi:hypothetical protein